MSHPAVLTAVLALWWTTPPQSSGAWTVASLTLTGALVCVQMAEKGSHKEIVCF